MALNLPYQYSIDVSIDDNIESLGISNPGGESKFYTFKLRTKFKVLRKHDDDDDDEGMYDCMTLGTECLTATFCVPKHACFVELFNPHFRHIYFRLKEYLMPNYQILTLIHHLFNLAEIVSVDPSPVVPVVADVTVCTKQLVGETIQEVLDRSVRPDRLTPLDLVRPVEKENRLCHRRVRDFLLYGLPRVRVDKGSGLMEECSICMGGPRCGTLVSWLPCKHAFHSHCIVRWLMKRQSCPMCRQEIVLAEKGGLPTELGCYTSNTHHDVRYSDL